MRLPTLARAAAAALLLASGCRTERDAQRDFARTLRPAWIAPDAAPPAGLRELTIRIQARADYRGETIAWRERALAQVERANALLGAQLGVRLVVREVRAWERVSDRRDLVSALQDLAATDPGDDVDWVMGLVGSLSTASADHEQVGLAQPFGRHFVVRGLASLADAELVHSLAKLDEEEREDLLADRRRHRETQVLLHEWAHTVGAVHERDPRSPMHPSYHHRQGPFSPFAARAIALGLEGRRLGGRGLGRWADAYARLLDDHRALAWDAATVDAARQASRAFAAWAERRPIEPAAGAAGAPREPGERRLAPALDAAGESDAARALELARAGACTEAEPVALRVRDAKGAGAALARCRWTRQWLALPIGVKGVPPAREPEYVAAVKAAREHVETGRVHDARRAADALARRFPGSPGPDLVRCLAEARLGDPARMRAACARAARAAPGAYEPAFILGRVAMHERRWTEARDQLRRALASDDEDREAWARLGAVHRALGEEAALAELDRRHRERFGAPLPAAW